MPNVRWTIWLAPELASFVFTCTRYSVLALTPWKTYRQLTLVAGAAVLVQAARIGWFGVVTHAFEPGSTT